MIALVDCNNFYASCERLFRPDLKQAAIVVLSNNDACVVARSQQAKAMGIKMGVPLFQLRQQLCQQTWQKLHLFSSNYALYGDISARIMHCLSQLVPNIEIYSIDEAFLDLTNYQLTQSYSEFGKYLRQQVYQHVGITVSIGIANSKTLAKVANHAAKQYPKTGGVVCIEDALRHKKLLQMTNCSDIWGVGRQFTRRLNQLKIDNAWQLANSSTPWIRQQFNSVLAKTVLELNGTPCFEETSLHHDRKQIVCSRSLQPAIDCPDLLAQALAHFICKALAKCRKKQLLTNEMHLFIQGDRFSSPVFYQHRHIKLLQASQDSRPFLNAMRRLLANLNPNNQPIKRVGIMLLNLHSSQQQQLDLLTPKADTKLCHLIDHINTHCQATVNFASAGLQKHWPMQQAYLSPAYTQHWQHLPKVK